MEQGESGTVKKQKQISQGNMTVLCSLLVVLAAQLNVNLFVSEFKISLAVILFPLFYFLIEDFQVIRTTLLVAPGILLFRTAAELLRQVPLDQALAAYAPETVFYLIYGLLFWQLTKKVDFHHFDWRNFPFLAGIDLLSNVGELLVRPGIDPFNGQILAQIAIIALGRSVLAAALLGGLSLYGELSLQQDERERYKKLLLLISRMKGELIWMEKNTVAIEDTMTVSYQLYHQLKEENSPLAQRALTVAKDVHEIKKEYRLIMKGLSEALNKDVEEKGMWIGDILDILKESCVHLAKTQGKEVKLELSCRYDFYTDKHYYLMSILRNLMTNALEALEQGCAHLELEVDKTGEQICFSVKDDCGGIEKEYLDAIFLPGFSTKFSEETGEVNRGLGLALVQDMVTQELGGSISVQSDDGHTEFIIQIPAKRLEV